MIVASNETVFGLPEVKRSLVAAAGGLFRLPRALGMATAMELITTGDPLPAQRAYELGMVNKVVDKADVLDEAKALASRIMANAPLAVQASRNVASKAMIDDDSDLWRAGNKAFQGIVGTEDYKEALGLYRKTTAQLEREMKKAPAFKNRPVLLNPFAL